MGTTTARWLCLICAALVGACGGNWSNDDLVFLHALPSKDTLTARVPALAQQQGGLGQRKDGLSLGAPSPLYAKTVKAAETFNGVLFGMLDMLDAARRLSPTRRETDRRTWGPFDDRQNPGRQVRLIVERTFGVDEATAYQWRLQARLKTQSASEDAWVSLVEGAYVPSEEIRRGAGTMTHNAQAVREAGFAHPQANPALRTLDVTYATDRDPVEIAMHFVFADATLDSEWRERADGSGSLRFDIRADIISTGFGGPETLRYDSAWAASGAGRTDATALAGGDLTQPLDLGEECWDAAFKTVYFVENYDLDDNGQAEGTSGDAAACAVGE